MSTMQNAKMVNLKDKLEAVETAKVELAKAEEEVKKVKKEKSKITK